MNTVPQLMTTKPYGHERLADWSFLATFIHNWVVYWFPNNFHDLYYDSDNFLELIDDSKKTLLFILASSLNVLYDNKQTQPLISQFITNIQLYNSISIKSFLVLAKHSSHSSHLIYLEPGDFTVNHWEKF